MKNETTTVRLLQIDYADPVNHMDVPKLRVGFVTESPGGAHEEELGCWETEAGVQENYKLVKYVLVRSLSVLDPRMFLKGKEVNTRKLTAVLRLLVESLKRNAVMWWESEGVWSLLWAQPDVSQLQPRKWTFRLILRWKFLQQSRVLPSMGGSKTRPDPHGQASVERDDGGEPQRALIDWLPIGLFMTMCAVLEDRKYHMILMTKDS